jgi:SWI/SNF-related matrix-associated actin-dependent regulator of chromatin subfamily A-like protein 1
MIRVTQEGDIAIFNLDKFLGQDRFRDYQGAVAGCRYDPERQVYYAPVARVMPMLQRLKSAGFTQADVKLDPNLRKSLEALVLHRRRDLLGAEGRADEIDRRMKEKGIALYPFQREGVRFLAGRRAALLADDMGLGKTVQALAAAPDGAPVLVMGLSVAKGVWVREAKQWRSELRPTALSGRSSFHWPKKNELVAINFDILPPSMVSVDRDGRDVHLFNVAEYGRPASGTVMVVDEAQYLKSSRSERSIRARAIAEEVRNVGGRVWLLTGTPIMNKPPELWNMLRVADLEREAFESWKKFLELFGGYKDGYGQTHWSTKPDESVPARLQRVMLRRTKEGVLPDLPQKTTNVLEVEVKESERAELDKIAFTLRGWCDTSDPYAVYEMTKRERIVFDTIAKLRSLLAVLKIPAMIEFIESHESTNEPLIVMSAHLEPLKALRKRDGWAVIDGSVPAMERTAIEEKFQRGELLGVACSIRAAGTALTLTRAANVLFIDESWTPSENEQAEDRLCRIGQKRGVLVTRMFVDHELDKHVLRVLGRKEKLIQRTLGEVTEREHEGEDHDE